MKKILIVSTLLFCLTAKGQSEIDFKALADKAAESAFNQSTTSSLGLYFAYSTDNVSKHIEFTSLNVDDNLKINSLSYTVGVGTRSGCTGIQSGICNCKKSVDTDFIVCNCKGLVLYIDDLKVVRVVETELGGTHGASCDYSGYYYLSNK